jgi:hypothetical protein
MFRCIGRAGIGRHGCQCMVIALVACNFSCLRVTCVIVDTCITVIVTAHKQLLHNFMFYLATLSASDGENRHHHLTLLSVLVMNIKLRSAFY